MAAPPVPSGSSVPDAELQGVPTGTPQLAKYLS